MPVLFAVVFRWAQPTLDRHEAYPVDHALVRCSRRMPCWWSSRLMLRVLKPQVWASC